MTVNRIVIVGATGSSHIGGSLMRGAADLSISARLCDISLAWRSGTIGQKMLWHFGGRKPVAFSKFSRFVVRTCKEHSAQVLVSTGNAPIAKAALRECRELGVKCVNYSTDDPFSPKHRSHWFLEALRDYDIVFTPRRSNKQELSEHGCRRVEYLPFAYDPHLFFPLSNVAQESDLFFAGTAEAERATYIAAAIEGGLKVRLHGSYWERFGQTRRLTRGQADLAILRQAIASTQIALCLVRHENRDGHSMRTFELPAVGACMLVEDTKEHREIFGEEGINVDYCSTPIEMVRKARALIDDAEARNRLRDAAHKLIVEGRNTYADRLATMLEA